MNYISPVNIFYSDLKNRIEDEIVKCIQSLNIAVNKEELVKALEYDRGQYEKGYADGYADGVKNARDICADIYMEKAKADMRGESE